MEEGPGAGVVRALVQAPPEIVPLPRRASLTPGKEGGRGRVVPVHRQHAVPERAARDRADLGCEMTGLGEDLVEDLLDLAEQRERVKLRAAIGRGPDGVLAARLEAVQVPRAAIEQEGP